MEENDEKLGLKVGSDELSRAVRKDIGSVKDAPTYELCRELKRRQGVSYTMLNPDGVATVRIEGPATIYVVID